MNTGSAALLALRAFRSSNLSSGSSTWILSRNYASTKKGPAKGTGGASADVNIDGKNVDPPNNVFKKVDKSGLMPEASKTGGYKNPEYFSYHNMSYTDMEIVMEKFRVQQPSSKK